MIYNETQHGDVLRDILVCHPMMTWFGTPSLDIMARSRVADAWYRLETSIGVNPDNRIAKLSVAYPSTDVHFSLIGQELINAAAALEIEKPPQVEFSLNSLLEFVLTPDGVELLLAQLERDRNEYPANIRELTPVPALTAATRFPGFNQGIAQRMQVWEMLHFFGPAMPGHPGAYAMPFFSIKLVR